MSASRSPGEVYHVCVYYSGHVQGVGFRYQTLQVARGYEVAGYVQNMIDGRVLVEAEGARLEVEAFLGALEEGMGDYIRRSERVSGHRPPLFAGFRIR